MNGKEGGLMQCCIPGRKYGNIGLPAGIVILVGSLAAPVFGQTAPAPTPPASRTGPMSTSAVPSDYSRRVVAYIRGANGDIAITREELGEYLITREGAEKLELLVNKRIIEEACRQRKIEVTAAEVEATLQNDLKGMNVNREDFVKRVLKQRGKTLYEWKEDVIKPGLALKKMCKDRVQITQDDLKMAFEAHYGEKVEVRLILFPKGEEKIALTSYTKIRDSEPEFDRLAKQQASPSLAATGGVIRPIARHTTGNEDLEKEAFSLQPKEISRAIETPEGIVLMKCVRHLPAETDRSMEREREALSKEVFEKKIQMEIPKFFKELQAQAQPNLILKNYTTEEQLLRDVRQEIAGSPTAVPPAQRKPPHAN